MGQASITTYEPLERRIATKQHGVMIRGMVCCYMNATRKAIQKAEWDKQGPVTKREAY